MQETEKEISHGTISRKTQAVSFDFTEDDDMDIDIKSSTDSEETLEDFTSNGRNNKQKGHIADASAFKTKRKVVPMAVYGYASTIHQNRLDEDVSAILGSSDPPAGFGNLHPPVHYLRQQRPFPLDPLPVWRGYNGNIYFSPIQVQSLHNDQSLSPVKSQFGKKIDNKQPDCTHLPTYKNRKVVEENTNITTNHEAVQQLFNHTTQDDDAEDQEPTKQPWLSILTTSLTRSKPVWRPGQLPKDDPSEEKSSKDKRQILPNIRPIPKPKLIRRGLAYKESKQRASFTNQIKSDTCQQAFNLNESHSQKSSHPTQARHNHHQPSFTRRTSNSTKDQASVDLREIRKRIIKGPTTATSFHTPAQHMPRLPSPIEHKPLLNPSMYLPDQVFNSSNLTAAASSVTPQHQFKHNAAYTTPNLSQYFEVYLTNNNVNIA
ncbi:unnamed protein product [Adineta ricciae]|uniref:Uncharacterized protein n=1 Tax=Adineta ricciae TaxID=249248 RepID=A0A814AAQ2_ADIRI|nr:unnamed protein product [Adineta ricciae]CAF1221258.1 unnamed protein product [Adineta ricciae]